MKLKNFFAALLLLTMVQGSVFAQNANLNVLKTPTKVVNSVLKHAATINVRAILNDLNPGDFVENLEVEVKGGQLGSQMELIVDSTVVQTIDLFGQFRRETFLVRLRNGEGYKRLTLRSIGESTVRRVTAVVTDGFYEDDVFLPPAPLPPQPPPPAVEPIIIIQPPPTSDFGVTPFNANCKTKSAGITFYSQSELGAVQLCNNANGFFNINSGECFALSECNAPRMQCSSSANGIPVIAYSRDVVIQKCRSIPGVSWDNQECDDFARCKGSDFGPVEVQPPQPPPIFIQPPTNFFDPNKPCHTKSNTFKFSAYSDFEVKKLCSQFAPQYTQRSVCEGNALCSGPQNGGGHGGGPGGHGHNGGGHIGPLPNQNIRCINFSRGRIFPGASFQQVLNDCRSNQPNTNGNECDNNVFCTSFGRACISFSNNRPFYAGDENSAAELCRGNYSTNSNECNQTARCY